MGLTFEYEDKDPGGKKFHCSLKCTKCKAKNADGSECKRKVCIGIPFCWYHLARDHSLKIKNGRYGKGVFAFDPKKPPNATIFRKDDMIANYDGEIINKQESSRRYGKDKTGPYAAGLYNGKVEDGACSRGVGTLFNHSNRKNEKTAALVDWEVGRGRNKKTIAGIQAKKAVKNGKEIFISYGTKYKFNENTRHGTKYRKN